MENESLPMQIFIGADHRGFKLAEAIILWARDRNLSMIHLGAQTYDKNDDYVDYALAVAQKVRDENLAQHPAMGIVICGSGVGVDVVANKTMHVRCCLGFNEKQVREARNDDNVNVLALAADFTDIGLAKNLVLAFLTTPFNVGVDRYTRRLQKIENLTVM